MIRNRFSVVLGIFAIALVWILLAPATGEAKSLWHLRGFGLWIEPDLAIDIPADEETDISAEADGAFGLGLSAEYQFSDRVGLELGIFRASPEVILEYHLRLFDLSFSVSDDLAMTPVYLGLPVHLLPESRIDVYLSPFLAYVRYSDLEFTIHQTFEFAGQQITLRDSARVSVASDVAYGAMLGVDFPFSSRPWAIATSLRYLATELDATDPEGEGIRPDFDSWILTAGIRYSF